MAKKTIMLTIEEDVLRKVKENLEGVGGSISSVVEGMLKKFNDFMTLQNDDEKEEVIGDFHDKIKSTSSKLKKLKKDNGG